MTLTSPFFKKVKLLALTLRSTTSRRVASRAAARGLRSLTARVLAALLSTTLLLAGSIILLLGLALTLVGRRLLVASLPSRNRIGVGIAGTSRTGVVIIAAGAGGMAVPVAARPFRASRNRLVIVGVSLDRVVLLDDENNNHYQQDREQDR